MKDLEEKFKNGVCYVSDDAFQKLGYKKAYVLSQMLRLRVYMKDTVIQTTNETLSKLFHLGLSTFRRYKKELIELGYIKVSVCQHKMNKYEFNDSMINEIIDYDYLKKMYN